MLLSWRPEKFTLIFAQTLFSSLILVVFYVFVYVFMCLFVFDCFKPDQTLQMVHSTISWPQVLILFWGFVLILSRLLWECPHILPLVSIGVLIWLQIYKFFEVRDYKFLQEPENFITNFNILEMTSKYIILRLGSRNWRDLLP